MISRREFLKTTSAFSVSSLSGKLKHAGRNGKKSILIVVFDAFSATNIPFYGYSRNTTPHIARILDQAVVYHRHYASGNYTSPGTASMLTGLYPWKHGAINLRGKVRSEYERSNMFSYFPAHYKFAHTQNQTANVYLDQFKDDIDDYVIPEFLYLHAFWPGYVFRSDADTAKIGARSIFLPGRSFGNSLFLKNLATWSTLNRVKPIEDEYINEFPRGLPSPHSSYREYYRIEDVNDWLMSLLENVPYPFLGYVHLLPPHARYNTRVDYVNVFENDGYEAIEKPTHLLRSDDRNNAGRYARSRQQYDEYILYVDSEFKRLYDFLSTNGILENTILIFTSDHGEIFERGYSAHSGETLHEPVIKVPMMIFSPGISKRIDIHTPTSAVDLLPTLLYLNGLPLPEIREGDILPPFKSDQNSRDVFALQAQGNHPKQIKCFTSMIVNEEYKLTYYSGYPELADTGPIIELYDMESDPEELENIYHPNDQIGKQLLGRLTEKLEQNL